MVTLGLCYIILEQKEHCLKEYMPSRASTSSTVCENFEQEQNTTFTTGDGGPQDKPQEQLVIHQQFLLYSKSRVPQQKRISRKQKYSHYIDMLYPATKNEETQHYWCQNT